MGQVWARVRGGTLVRPVYYGATLYLCMWRDEQEISSKVKNKMGALCSMCKFIFGSVRPPFGFLLIEYNFF